MHSQQNIKICLLLFCLLVCMLQRGKAMANYPQELVQDAVCQSHTGHMTGLWFLPARPLRLNTNEWMNECCSTTGRLACTFPCFLPSKILRIYIGLGKSVKCEWMGKTATIFSWKGGKTCNGWTADTYLTSVTIPLTSTKIHGLGAIPKLELIYQTDNCEEQRRSGHVASRLDLHRRRPGSITGQVAWHLWGHK